MSEYQNDCREHSEVLKRRRQGLSIDVELPTLSRKGEHRRKNSHGLPHCQGLYEEVPEHQKNPFIYGSYRVNFDSKLNCIRSLFMLHNESLNTWTHAAACLYFIYKAIKFVWHIKGTWKFEDVVVFIPLCSCIWCMAASSWFHLLLCLPCHKTHLCLLSADMAGILMVIFTLYFGVVSLCFGKERIALQSAYLTYTVLAGLLAVMPLTMKRLSSWGKLGMIAFALSCALPVGHFISVANIAELQAFGLPSVACAFFFLVALVFYFSFWPECQYPGKCDIWLHSHTLWHIFVFLGIWAAVQGLLALHALRT